MTYYKKHFTLAEARAALPSLRRRILRIHELLAEIRKKQEEAGTRTMLILRGNGKGPIISESLGAQTLEAQGMIEQIAAEGIQIKDLQRGLVDFPHLKDGDPEHEVLLCWLLGEDSIEFWHEIEDGFAGRTPI